MNLGDRLITNVFASVQGNKHHFIWKIHNALYDGWLMSVAISQNHRAYLGQDLEHETSFEGFIKYLTTQNLDLEQSQNYWKSRPGGNFILPSLPSRTYQSKS